MRWWLMSLTDHLVVFEKGSSTCIGCRTDEGCGTIARPNDGLHDRSKPAAPTCFLRKLIAVFDGELFTWYHAVSAKITPFSKS
jgi:hypothetical protein